VTLRFLGTRGEIKSRSEQHEMHARCSSLARIAVALAMLALSAPPAGL
jgi:hypothetical protein